MNAADRRHTHMRAFLAGHRLLVGSIALVVVAVTAFVLLYFEPQTLFIDDRVDDPLPTVAGDQASSAAPRTGGGERPEPAIETLRSGTFRSYEHSTSGEARAIRLPDGSRYLRLEDFETSNGPDVRVYLSAAPAGGPGDTFDDDYGELGELKGNIGDQNYTIPAGVDLDRFGTAVIWCERFSVAFGAAPLA
jgi:hypothetical protein